MRHLNVGNQVETGLNVRMNAQWQEKMKSVGAIFQHEADNEIGEQALSKLPWLVDLSPLAIVDVTGEDAVSFLQAQVCNDLTSLAADEAQINGYCSPKGRLLALFTVYAISDGYRLIVPADVAPAFTKRLQMFVMRAQVNVSVRDDLVCVGLVFKSGKASVPAPIAQHISTLPDANLRHSGDDQLQMLKWHDSPIELAEQQTSTRYIVVGPQDDLLTLWKDAAFTAVSWSFWRWGDINAGIPTVHAVSTEQFIPQMLNMQLINALSFKKGCYPGQEIVARMQYLGKLKKRMKHLHAPGVTEAPVPGDVLVTETNNNAGQVVDAIVDSHGVSLLAVVNKDTPVSELSIGGVALQEASLPYEFPPETDSDS